MPVLYEMDLNPLLIGDITGASNLGAGLQVFASEIGGILNFRTLVFSADFTAVQTPTEIQIALASPPGDITGAANLGAGLQVFASEVAGILNFRTLVFSSAFTTTQTPTELNIDVDNRYIITQTASGAVAITFASLVKKNLYVATAVGGPQVFTLPIPIATDDGKSIIIKNRNMGGGLTVLGGGGLLIDGAGVVAFALNMVMEFVYSHATTEWFII